MAALIISAPDLHEVTLAGGGFHPETNGYYRRIAAKTRTRDVIKPEIQSIALAIKNAPRYQRCLLRQCRKVTQKAMFSAIGEASDSSDVFQFYCQHNNDNIKDIFYRFFCQARITAVTITITSLLLSLLPEEKSHGFSPRFQGNIALAIKNAPRFQRCLLRQCGKLRKKAMFSAIGEGSDSSDGFQFYCQHNIISFFLQNRSTILYFPVYTSGVDCLKQTLWQNGSRGFAT